MFLILPSHHALWPSAPEKIYHQVLDTHVLYLHIMPCGLDPRRIYTIRYRYWILMYSTSPHAQWHTSEEGYHQVPTTYSCSVLYLNIMHCDLVQNLE
jgi:hypothetical protein